MEQCWASTSEAMTKETSSFQQQVTASKTTHCCTPLMTSAPISMPLKPQTPSHMMSPSTRGTTIKVASGSCHRVRSPEGSTRSREGWRSPTGNNHSQGNHTKGHRVQGSPADTITIHINHTRIITTVNTTTITYRWQLNSDGGNAVGPKQQVYL